MDRSRFYRRPLFLWVAVAIGIVVLVSWALSGSPSYTQATTSDVLSVIHTNPGNIEKATIEDKEQTVDLDLANKVKLAEAAKERWRRLNGHNQLPQIVLGIKFAHGIEVVRSQAQIAAA